MHVVAASMHDGDVHPEAISRTFVARVVETGLLPHGEGVHVGTQQRCRAHAVVQDADDAGAAHARGGLVAPGGEPFGHDRRRPVLLEGQFRVAVQIAVQICHLIVGQR